MNIIRFKPNRRAGRVSVAVARVHELENRYRGILETLERGPEVEQTRLTLAEAKDALDKLTNQRKG